MNNVLRLKSTLFYMFIVFVGFVFLIPLVYLLSISLTSKIELADFPRPLIPSLTHQVQFKWNEDDQRYEFSRLNNDGVYEDITFGDADYFSNYLELHFNVTIGSDELQKRFVSARTDSTPVKIKLYKSVFSNYVKFFKVFSGVGEALINSIQAAFYTIILALTIGGFLGYALARTKIKGKEIIGVGALVVRMFPTIAISVSAAVMLIKFGLFDSMIGLAIVYSIPNIGLTAWITRGIFIGVNRELEEASLVFGATRIQTFTKITLPLVLPAFAASSMYAFITAWNDTAVALLLTNENRTLALLLYNAIGGSGSIHYAAAGAILLIAPALVFTFFLRKYINQLWG